MRMKDLRKKKKNWCN